MEKLVFGMIAQAIPSSTNANQAFNSEVLYSWRAFTFTHAHRDRQLLSSHFFFFPAQRKPCSTAR
jgi:hypothetical protein